MPKLTQRQKDKINHARLTGGGYYVDGEAELPALCRLRLTTQPRPPSRLTSKGILVKTLLAQGSDPDVDILN